VSALQQCIPGRETIERLSDQEMTASVKLKIGPMMVCFTGIVTLSDLDPPSGYTITGKGSGAIAGFAKGSAAIRLVFDGQPTPAKWKTFLVTWIGVCPTLLLIMYALARRARPKFVATHSTRYQLSSSCVVSDLADHAAFNQSAATVAVQRPETGR